VFVFYKKLIKSTNGDAICIKKVLIASLDFKGFISMKSQRLTARLRCLAEADRNEIIKIDSMV